MAEIVLLLGSNLGNRLRNLELAIRFLKEDVGHVLKQSSIYESEPWGFECSNPFLNQVVVLKTKLNAFSLLEKIQQIENKLNRERKSNGYESRTIDIDILFMDEMIMNTKALILPHPLLHQRNFTLVPLCEIIPQKKHPVLKKTMAQLLHGSMDQLGVEKISG